MLYSPWSLLQAQARGGVREKEEGSSLIFGWGRAHTHKRKGLRAQAQSHGLQDSPGPTHLVLQLP